MYCVIGQAIPSSGSESDIDEVEINGNCTSDFLRALMSLKF